MIDGIPNRPLYFSQNNIIAMNRFSTKGFSDNDTDNDTDNENADIWCWEWFQSATKIYITTD